MVESQPSKLLVAGPIPVSRSIKTNQLSVSIILTLYPDLPFSRALHKKSEYSLPTSSAYGVVLDIFAQMRCRVVALLPRDQIQVRALHSM